MESRVSAAEGLGVEQVPPLQHDERREEERHLMHVHACVCHAATCPKHGASLTVEEEHHHREEQQQAHRENALRDGARYDEVGLSARLLQHHVMCGRQRSQRHGSKRVHDEVYPQNLRHGERQFGAYDRAAKHKQQSHHVDHKLEEEKTLYVLIERASPHHRLHDAAEGVVDERYVAGVLRHAGARAERQAHMCVVESRRIVGAVARHSHHLAVLLQQVHETLLVGGTGTAHHLHLLHIAISLVIAESLEGGTCDLCLGRRVVIPCTYLSGNLYGCGGGVARHDLHAYSGRAAVGDSVGHILAYGVADAHNSLKREVLDRERVGTSASKRQRAHGLVLPLAELLTHSLSVCLTNVAEAHHHLGSTLHKQPFGVVNGSQRGHILTLRTERQTVSHGVV